MQLANKFKNVFATDISPDQLFYAGKKPNIFYSLQAAEKTNLPSNFFNLITCGQSYHWFNFEKFSKEVKRVSKDGAIIAVWGYYLPRINPKNDKILDDFYHNVIYQYWEPERKHLEERYSDTCFPYENVEIKKFEIKEYWSKNHYFGYQSTWSFLKKFMEKNAYNPLADLFNALGLPDRFELHFPVFVKLGMVPKLGLSFL